MSRREFTRNQKEQIVERSKNERGQICCEKCRLVLDGKPHEIDHIIAEALRPEIDKQKKITIAEGQLLGNCCHRGNDGKTNKDVSLIAKAKRQYDRANGMKKPKSNLAKKSKEAQPLKKPPLPPRQLYRTRAEVAR